MKKTNSSSALARKVALIGILTALATALSFIKIPVVSTATITLVLPVVVIGSIICGPVVGAWLMVLPTIASLSEATLFMTYSPVGTLVTLFLKGILAGFMAGLVHKLLCKKWPRGAVVCAAIVAPVVNSGVFVLGCYIFLWDVLVTLAVEAGVGMGMLLFGLAGMNFILELILNLVHCPTIMRIIKIATKNK